MKRRPPANVTARRERVWTAFCRGVPQKEIAAAEGVDPMQIVRDLDALHAEHAGDPDAAARRAKAASLARSRYGLLIRKALDEWERSREDRKQLRTKARHKANVAPGPDSTEATQVTEARLGDPQYLMVAIRAQQRLDAIEGTEAPKQLEHSGKIELRNLTDEQLDKQITELEARTRRTTDGAAAEGGAPAPS